MPRLTDQLIIGLIKHFHYIPFTPISLFMLSQLDNIIDPAQRTGGLTCVHESLQVQCIDVIAVT